MKRSLLLLATVAACARPQYRAQTAEVVLTVEGRVRGAPVQFDAAGLGTIERRSLQGRAPAAPAAKEFQGPSLLALIRELEPRREVDLAVVHGSDGYAVAIPLPAIRQHQPVLADRADGKPVAEALPGSGGSLLAWPNASAPGFDLDPRVRWWWVRDVKRIELVPWSETYGRALRVPPGSSDAARRGADRYANSCIHCHRLRDVGGKRGPDLSKGLGPQERERFTATVRAHAERVPETRGADLGRDAAEVAAFLELVQAYGPLPAEDTAPELKPRDENPDPQALPPPTRP